MANYCATKLGQVLIEKGPVMKLLVAGATGLVGSHVVTLALDSAEVDQVVALTRRPLPPHPRLLCVPVDLEKLPADADWWRADAVICALGTTIRKAGSPQAFERVDHDYPLMIAKHAKRAGASIYVLNSAIGADPNSRLLYNRTKGRVERDLQAMEFRSLTLVRPGLIGGERDEFRPAERIAAILLGIAAPVLPRRWRINPAENIARALVTAALAGEAGVHIIQSQEMV